MSDNLHLIPFRTEYICLKCGYTTDKSLRKCPKCEGPMCPRVIKVAVC